MCRAKRSPRSMRKRSCRRIRSRPPVTCRSDARHAPAVPRRTNTPALAAGVGGRRPNAASIPPSPRLPGESKLDGPTRFLGLKEIELTSRILVIAASLLWVASALAADVTLLNVSYDPTRELYADFNKAFAVAYQKETGKSVEIKQSHGGAGAKARAVIDGLKADIVTLALAYDVVAIAAKGPLAPDWQQRLPLNASPYTSTTVFLVRKGNPKGIRDWDDLVKRGVSVITPNPKTSGGARWNYLAAWGYALKKYGSADGAKKFVGDLYQNVPVLDAGARGSTVSLLERGVGDVLLAWENEAFLAQREFGKNKFEIVSPPLSILAEPPVAVVDAVADRKATRGAAEAYLKYWYTREGQEIAARNSYRPRDPEIAKEYEASFAKVELFTIDDVFGGWSKAQKEHFAEGGIFDQIYKN